MKKKDQKKNIYNIAPGGDQMNDGKEKLYDEIDKIVEFQGTMEYCELNDKERRELHDLWIHQITMLFYELFYI